MTPTRLQRPRVRGWRVPEGAVYVGPGSRWANPWRWRTRQALARVPALDGSPWEYETRISANGHHHPYFHPDGRVTSHTSRYLTRRECVELFERALTNPSGEIYLPRGRYSGPALTVADARADLAGRDLVCRCALNQVCHADALIAVANATEETP